MNFLQTGDMEIARDIDTYERRTRRTDEVMQERVFFDQKFLPVTLRIVVVQIHSSSRRRHCVDSR